VTSTLTVTGALSIQSGLALDYRRLVIGPQATATWTGGGITLELGAQIDNRGAFPSRPTRGSTGTSSS